jgi:uncharacterized protein
MNYHAAKAYIVDKLNKELSPKLTYHGIHHTFDVLQVTEQLCDLERIPVYERMLLKTAVLFHDSGFIWTIREHESRGCELAREVLPSYDYTELEIERICSMIMATRIPQSPKNKLEEIICDADLDYLGRDDFYTIGASLFEELKTFGVLDSEEEWNRVQLRFLGNHTYFTVTNKKRRAPKEQSYLRELESIVAAY